MRSFGKEYHGGGHGIDIRKEGGEEFLYLCDRSHRQVIKTNLKGERRLDEELPARKPASIRTCRASSPTNVAFAPDGGFYVGDGYGSHYIHQYDKDAKWVRTWGGPGNEPGKMKTPHGLWLDDRPGREPSLVVADRANARLQYFTLDGKHLSVINKPHLSFPAHFDIRGDVLLVPDLHARVSLFDKNNAVITHLGYDQAWTDECLADGFKMRREPRALEGRQVHPPARRLLRQRREHLRRGMGGDRPHLVPEARVVRRVVSNVSSARLSRGESFPSLERNYSRDLQ